MNRMRVFNDFDDLKSAGSSATERRHELLRGTRPMADREDSHQRFGPEGGG